MTIEEVYGAVVDSRPLKEETDLYGNLHQLSDNRPRHPLPPGWELLEYNPASSPYCDEVNDESTVPIRDPEGGVWWRTTECGHWHGWVACSVHPTTPEVAAALIAEHEQLTALRRGGRW